jgi:glycosyltransferase involved in cell wall biosynthesis
MQTPEADVVAPRFRRDRENSMAVIDLAPEELRSLDAPEPFRQRDQLTAPLVSVVIPTRNRPELLVRALDSALDQSLRDIEVVVVIDGPDIDTLELLHGIEDERLHVLSLHAAVGGAEARNIGVRYSRGRWIAFLDDDDEWFVEKLAFQWNAVSSAVGPWVFVVSKFVERGEDADRVLPGRLPGVKEKFSDYMFSRKGWNSGEGFLQTSTWFVSRELLVQVPFTTGLKRCQDLDWLLHAATLPTTQVVVVPEVLAIFHHEDSRERVSRTPDWKFLYDWGVANRRYFTSRAFSFFIATYCVPSAATQREGIGTFLFLLRACLSPRTWSAKCIVLFALCGLLSEDRRRNLRAFFSNRIDVGHPRPALVHPSIQSKVS